MNDNFIIAVRCSFYDEHPGLMLSGFPVTNVEFAITLDFSVCWKGLILGLSSRKVPTQNDCRLGATIPRRRRYPGEGEVKVTK